MTNTKKIFSAAFLGGALLLTSGASALATNGHQGQNHSGDDAWRLPLELLDSAKTHMELGVDATLTSMTQDSDGGGTLTVTLRDDTTLQNKDGDTFLDMDANSSVSIHYAADTIFVRRFFGKATASELVTGDHLVLVLSDTSHDDGSDDGDTSGTVHAKAVMDMSIWRKGVSDRIVTVTSVDAATNTLMVTADKNWDEQDTSADADSKMATVTYDNDTKFVAKGGSSTEEDLKVGAKIRIWGTARVQDDDDSISIFDVSKILVDVGVGNR